jgi:hypothetical protein
MDDLELLARSRPETAPSPETVERHRRALAEAMASVVHEPHPSTDDLSRRRGRLAAVTLAAVVLAGVAAATLPDDDGAVTRVVTAPPAAQASTTTTAPGTILPCGWRLPDAISEGPYDHHHEGTDPESIGVRIYACRVERSLPETLTGPDGRTREMVTTLRELTERFGGPEGSVLDEFGRAHPISLAPLAGADPDTTAVGLVWSTRPRDAPPLPAGHPKAPPPEQSLTPPWLQNGRP